VTSVLSCDAVLLEDLFQTQLCIGTMPSGCAVLCSCATTGCVCATQVTPHPQCKIRIEVLDKTSSAGNLFIVQGIAIVPYSSAPLLTPTERLLLRSIA
jgi:hypothetical protein